MADDSGVPQDLQPSAVRVEVVCFRFADLPEIESVEVKEPRSSRYELAVCIIYLYEHFMVAVSPD